MTLNYLKKLDKIRDEMFNISLGLKETFDFAMDCHDKQAVENNYQTKIKKFSKLELAENRSIKAVVSFAGLFFLR